MKHHAIRRTSHKGEAFIGTCWRCGKTGLNSRDFFHDECPNVRGTTQEQDILEAIDPDDANARPEPAQEDGK